MKIVDANLLIYAVNSSSPMHVPAKRWLDQAITSPELLGFTWIVILAFLRITTNERVHPSPIVPENAIGVMDEWLGSGGVTLVHPGENHLSIFRELLRDCGTFGNRTNDAHLAAIAIEHGARLYSTDSDFSRFSSVRWENPIK